MSYVLPSEDPNSKSTLGEMINNEVDISTYGEFTRDEIVIKHIYDNEINWYQHLRNLLITHFKKGNLATFCDSMEFFADYIYTVLLQLRDERFLDNSIGIQLDNMGSIFDLLRNSSESDIDYRLRLQHRRSSLKYSGTFEEIFTHLRYLTDDSVHSMLIENYPASLIAQTNGIVNRSIYNDLRAIKSVSIYFDLAFHVGIPIVFLNDDESVPAYGSYLSEWNGDDVIDEGGELTELFI